MDVMPILKTALQIGRSIIPEVNIAASTVEVIIAALKANGATIPDDLPIAIHKMNGQIIDLSDEALAVSAAWRAAHPAPKP
jgi:hypothetical protein